VVMDLHGSQRTEEVRSPLASEGNRFVYIPAGCTSLCQVHDVAVVRSSSATSGSATTNFLTVGAKKFAKPVRMPPSAAAKSITREDLPRFISEASVAPALVLWRTSPENRTPSCTRASPVKRPTSATTCTRRSKATRARQSGRRPAFPRSPGNAGHSRCAPEHCRREQRSSDTRRRRTRDATANTRSREPHSGTSAARSQRSLPNRPACGDGLVCWSIKLHARVRFLVSRRTSSAGQFTPAPVAAW
jgi:hypothetical protein